MRRLRVRENIFYGSLRVRAGAMVHEIDARPSDAITIALDRDAPIARATLLVAPLLFRTPTSGAYPSLGIVRVSVHGGQR